MSTADRTPTQPAAPDDAPAASGPPIAPLRPLVREAHGDRRVDDYAWLENRDDPETLAHLAAEDRWARERLAHLEPLRQALFDEIKAATLEDDTTVPVPKGPYAYYTRTEEGRAYPIHCRRPRDGRVEDLGPEEVLLDENQLADGRAYFALGDAAVSPDHTRLAYLVDLSGGERFTLRVRDLATGEDLPSAVENAYYGLAWASDSATVFSTRPDEAMRPYQIWRHRFDATGVSSALVLEEDDPRFFLGVEASADERVILLTAGSKTTSEVHVLEAVAPEEAPRPIRRRQPGIEYAAEHWQRWFLLVSNERSVDFELLAVPETDPGAVPQVLVPAEEGVRLEGIDVFERFVACYERAGGAPRVRVVDLAALPAAAGVGAPSQLVAGPARVVGAHGPLESVRGTGNAEFHTSVLRYEHASLRDPAAIYDLDLATGEEQLRKRQPVPGYDPAELTTWREWATAEDGVAVPISLVARADVAADPTAPLLLYGYGSYEASIDPRFSVPRLPLLRRGVVYAIAHVRGGGELGRRWYLDGKLEHKVNTFTDFLAAARHLAPEGPARRRTVAMGASAGGLLMGAVANMAPELFAGIVAQVPFVDCLTTILDETLPLTATEWEEWGDPVRDPNAYQRIKAYSPYDNVAERPYPRILATTGLEDPRVSYWEPAKWVAKMRATAPGTDVLLHLEQGGHSGPSGRYEDWRDWAFVYAFVLDCLGLGS